jgi:predicted RNA-binding Zn ribbon-like protein
MSATSRFLLDPAPGGLELVQDLVNTRAVAPYGVRDLLGTVADAQRFTTDAVRAWKEHSGATGGVRRITSADLPALRRLRRDVERQVVGEGRGGVQPVAATLTVDATGAVRLQPTGAGVRWLASAIWGEVLLAQRDGRWERLKVCRNPDCPCAFYDRSRNNSRVWHDVRTCGNLANLRASRARRRADAG